MVQSIKPSITVIDNIEWQLLVLGITLLIFITVIFYFTRYYYKQNYYVSQEFDQQTGENKHTITQGYLKPCGKKGECVINLDTGIKKCPTNSNTLLYYDDTTETCTRKEGCPALLPYAVNGDGSVNKYGSCENSNIPCRCTDNITCSKYVASKFAVVNGNIYSSYASEKNFILEQVPYDINDSYDGSIKIDSSSEFCKINSTYSASLVGGCSFLNQTNDFLMKCQDESLNPDASVSPYSLDPYYYDTGSTIKKQFCEVQPYLDSNWNNMTLCINQNPCKIGNYTYNFDKYREKLVDGQEVYKNTTSLKKEKEVNSRNFCQSYASNLNTYLTDLQYYTLSCTVGTQCNKLPNMTDESKFFAGVNSELDISAINASYQVVYSNGTLFPKNLTTELKYNPFTNKIRSGDILYDGEDFYILRVNPWDNNNSITFYNFDSDVYSEQSAPSSTDLTYYPQYALNGFNYNTITTNDIDIFNSNLILTGDQTSLPTSYKIGNVTNSTVPDNPGGGYNPSYDILENSTFYRAGLSQPRGYVYKEFEQEEAVQQDITETFNQTSFNASNYKIKPTSFDTQYYNDISFYNPVWNNQYGKSECIRCSPLLVASINMAQTSSQGLTSGFIYDAVTIQFSGQDFGHYRKNFSTTDPEKIWCFESRAKINKAKISTTNQIYLERPNLNIQKGDLILSSGAEFNYGIKPVETVVSDYIGKTFYIFMGDVFQGQTNVHNFTPFYDTGITEDSQTDKLFMGLGVDDNRYQDFIKGQYISAQYNGSEFILNDTVTPSEANKYLGNNKTGGFFFGNKFTAVHSAYVPESSNFFQRLENFIRLEKNFYTVQVTLVPSVEVLDISKNKDVITTTGYISKSPFTSSIISQDSELQFISLNRNLYLNNDTSVINKELEGSGGEIQIDQITDGRITTIKVNESGSGYSNISPLVRLESYDRYIK